MKIFFDSSPSQWKKKWVKRKVPVCDSEMKSSSNKEEAKTHGSPSHSHSLPFPHFRLLFLSLGVKSPKWSLWCLQHAAPMWSLRQSMDDTSFSHLLVLRFLNPTCMNILFSNKKITFCIINFWFLRPLSSVTFRDWVGYLYFKFQNLRKWPYCIPMVNHSKWHIF